MSFSQYFSLSYRLQRSYSLRYFHRSIYTVLFVLFCLFTIFNVAANGYDVQTITTNDPNVTLAQRQWFLNPIFTFGDKKLWPKCQSYNLPINSDYTTTNFGGSYHLVSVSDNDGNMQPSLTYLNTGLRDCKVNNFTIEMKKIEGKVGDVWSDWDPSTAVAWLQCQTDTASGSYTLDFTSTMPGFDKGPVIKNISSHASLWWGRELLKAYFYGMCALKAQRNNKTTQFELQAEIGYIRRSENLSLERDDLLMLGYANILGTKGNWQHNISLSSGASIYNNPSYEPSFLITESLAFAKMYYCFVLADMGMDQEPNYLLDKQQLQRLLTEAPFDFNRGANGTLNTTIGLMWGVYNGVGIPGHGSVALNTSFDLFNSTSGLLGTQQATIFALYTCTVPSRKSIGTIVWTTLLANFVLLQAAYKFMMFVAESVVVNRDPTAMYCDGCLALSRDYEKTGGGMSPELDDGDDNHRHHAKDPSSRSGGTPYTLLQ